jgi:putative ABC transport system permease protein
MTFVSLMAHNVRTRPLRAVLTMVAVALGVTAVVAVGVLTQSLGRSAAAVVQTGRADFTVAQNGASDVIYSSLDQSEVAAVAAQPGVDAATGVLVSTGKLDADHPLFIELGLTPEDQAGFGVTVVAGRSYAPDATDDIMLGYRIANDLHRGVGDTLQIEERTFHIVGLYSTGNAIGDSAAMFPLPALQAWKRQPGTVTLVFARVHPGADIDAIRSQLEHEHPQLATVRSEADFGRIDRNLVFIGAANIGATILAVFIGAAGVMNTSMLSFFERIREFGVLRAIGWTSRRVLSLVFGEALVVSTAGAALGVVTGLAVIALLTRVPDLRGVFEPDLSPAVFWRALGFAFVMAFLGALYPAYRAARQAPLEAIRHE